jgi:hypothetical protein
MTEEPMPKGFVEAMAVLGWRPSTDEAAAYAQAQEAARQLPPSKVTADRVLAALAQREKRKSPAPAPISFENPLDEVFNRAARNGGEISAEVEARMRADRIEALRKKDPPT